MQGGRRAVFLMKGESRPFRSLSSGNKKVSSMAVEVRTIKELKNAIKGRDLEILLANPELSDKISRFKQLKDITVPKLVDGMTSYLSPSENTIIQTVAYMGVSELFELYERYEIEEVNETDSSKNRQEVVHKLRRKQAE